MFNHRSDYGSMAQGFMTKVYGWMCAGLATTAAVAYYFSPEMHPQMMLAVQQNFWAVIGLFIVQFGILMYMTSNYARLSYPTMSLLFLAFCALQGFTLAPLFFVYKLSSIVYVFAIASAMFACMAIYGTVTQADLSSMGNILFMGMVGLFIAQLINIFQQNPNFNILISGVGVGIFAMLTAYDVQNLKRYSHQMLSSPQEAGKFALLGAVSLYMNLINIFLYLLRLFGERRER